MKYLITGASGFIGSHLVEFLLQKNYQVCAISRKPNSVLKKNENLIIKDCSILESKKLRKIVLDFKPDVVFHLAAQSSPGKSIDNPSLTFEVNLVGTINILESIKDLDSCPRTILSSSSSVYSGAVDKESINEDHKIGPLSPYGLSKFNMEQLAEMYLRRYSMDIIINRPFFLIGPRKDDDICSAFAKNIVEIESGVVSEVEVGNLEIIRDFLDIRDGVQALYTISEKGVLGEIYNISSGQGVSLRNILDYFKGLSNSEIKEKFEQKRVRSIDETIRIGDSKKLMELGWFPRYKTKETITTILEYWRNKH